MTMKRSILILPLLFAFQAFAKDEAFPTNKGAAEKIASQVKVGPDAVKQIEGKITAEKALLEDAKKRKNRFGVENAGRAIKQHEADKAMIQKSKGPFIPKFPEKYGDAKEGSFGEIAQLKVAQVIEKEVMVATLKEWADGVTSRGGAVGVPVRSFGERDVLIVGLDTSAFVEGKTIEPKDVIFIQDGASQYTTASGNKKPIVVLKAVPAKDVMDALPAKEKK
jgi:hypothetical protein